jgi:hypothetical protein
MSNLPASIALGLVEPRVFQHLRHAHDAVERRANLVAHVGEEGRLRRARRLGLLLGGLEFLLPVAQVGDVDRNADFPPARHLPIGGEHMPAILAGRGVGFVVPVFFEQALDDSGRLFRRCVGARPLHRGGQGLAMVHAARQIVVHLAETLHANLVDKQLAVVRPIDRDAVVERFQRFKNSLDIELALEVHQRSFQSCAVSRLRRNSRLKVRERG